MPPWISHAWNLVIAAQGVMFLAHPIRAYFWAPRIAVLHDLGTRPWTIWCIVVNLFFFVSIINMAWVFIEMAPCMESLAYVVFLIGLLVYSTYESLHPLCLRDDGMRVMTRTLWWRTPRFLPWSAFKRYEWVDSTTLIVKSGEYQTTCYLPAEHVDSVKSIMQQKVPALADSLDQLQEQLP